MGGSFAVIGGDLRQRYLAEALCAKGFVTMTFAVPQMPNTKDTLQSTLEKADFVILPLPAIKNGTIFGTEFTAEEIAALLKPNTVVFGGKLDDAAPILAEKATVCDYFTREALAIGNAVPTAEGAIQLAMEALDCTVFDSHLLVIGAGRIGMCLAQKLQALGAHVTVSARKERDFAKICSLGLRAERTGVYENGLKEYDCIFNTVPAAVLDAEQLNRLQAGCVIIELASAPGGVSKNDCERLGISYLAGAALPGRVAPKTAGELILREILAILRRSSWNSRSSDSPCADPSAPFSECLQSWSDSKSDTRT